MSAPGPRGRRLPAAAYFLPPARRGDADLVGRARVTVQLTVTLAGVAVLYAAFYAFVVGFAAGAACTGGGAVLAVAALGWLRVTGRLGVLRHALTGALFAAVVLLVWVAGGLHSAVTPWLAVPPIFAALLLGPRGAARWAAASVAAVAGFWLAERAGVRTAPGYPAGWRTAVAFASHAGLVACTAALFTVYEQIRAAAQARAEAASAELARMAYHDALTGLANRARFLACTSAALARARAAGDPSRVAVLALDLDGFKAVNDTLGHEAGDAVLVEVAGRLLGATRGSDTVARLGGDEFAVLLDGVGDDADAGVVAARVVEAVGRPFVIAGAPARVGTSVGVARGDGVPPAGELAPDEGVATLLRHADYAMYQAKSLGKGRWAWFDAAETPAMAPAPVPAPRAPVRARAAAGAPGPARARVPAAEPCRRRA